MASTFQPHSTEEWSLGVYGGDSLLSWGSSGTRDTTPAATMPGPSLATELHLAFWGL